MKKLKVKLQIKIQILLLLLCGLILLLSNLKRSIEKAIKNASYVPLRIDDKKHINKIDDEILSEIEKARFVICDLTSEEKQPRGSVYFEAGYAKGKNIPIIYTCNERLKTEIPFDIRQI